MPGKYEAIRAYVACPVNRHIYWYSGHGNPFPVMHVCEYLHRRVQHRAVLHCRLPNACADSFRLIHRSRKYLDSHKVCPRSRSRRDRRLAVMRLHDHSQPNVRHLHLHHLGERGHQGDRLRHGGTQIQIFILDIYSIDSIVVMNLNVGHDIFFYLRNRLGRVIPSVVRKMHCPDNDWLFRISHSFPSMV